MVGETTGEEGASFEGVVGVVGVVVVAGGGEEGTELGSWGVLGDCGVVSSGVGSGSGLVGEVGVDEVRFESGCGGVGEGFVVVVLALSSSTSQLNSSSSLAFASGKRR